MARDETIKLSLIDGVTKSLSAIQKGVGGVGAELAKLNQVAELAGKAFDGLSSVGGFFADLVTDAGAYEQKLLEVETRTHATAEESKLLRDAIQGALQNTAVGATAAADALRLMAEDGASATEAAQNLGQTVAYAQANTRGLAETVGGLGAVLDAFGEAPAKIGALADALTATAVAAGTSTKAIEEGVSRAGIAAEQANLSLDETVALIGALAERGLEGGRGGAALVKVLQELNDPASKAGEALKQAGISGGDLSGIMQRLATDAALSEKVLSSLGDKPRATLKLLLSEGGKSLAGITKAIEESAGASQRASDQLGDGFALAQKRLAESLANMKIALATPLLEPLALAFNDFATRINTFAQSEQFKLIAEDIAKFVSVGLAEVQKFVEGFDFERAAAATAQFVSDARVELAGLREALGLTLTSGANFSDGLSAAFNASVAAVSLNLAGLLGALGGVSDEAESLSLSLAAIGDDAFIATGDALGRIAGRADEAAKETARLASEAKTLTADYVSAVGPLNAFGKSLEDQLANTEGLAPAFDATRNSVMRLVESEQKLAVAQREAQAAMSTLSIAAYEAQISRLVVEQNKLFYSGQQNTAAFRDYTAQINAAEAEIAKLKEASAAAAKSQDDLSEKTDKASESLRNQASAAGAASSGADNVSSSSDNASESLSNFEQQTKSVSFSLGTMTEAFAKQALAAAGAANSADGYVETWGAFVAQAEDVDKWISSHIENLKRQNTELDLEAKIRAQLEARYGTASSRLEELVQLELKLAEAKRKTNAESEREIEIEQRRAGQAGGFGTGAATTQQAAPTASGGRGTSGGAGTRDSSAPAIVINVQSPLTDEASAREFVSRFVVPALDRMNRLSR